MTDKIKCDRCKKEIEDKEGNYFYNEDNDSVYCVACADYLDAMANLQDDMAREED